jgi:exodeoxyribonuclease VII small subunit
VVLERWPSLPNGVFFNAFQAFHAGLAPRFFCRPMSDIAPKTADPPASFEAALAELESIVATMEGGQLPLAESLAAYRRGAELLQYCQGALKDAQQQVQVLERGVLKMFAPSGDDVEAGRNDEP